MTQEDFFFYQNVLNVFNKSIERLLTKNAISLSTLFLFNLRLNDLSTCKVDYAAIKCTDLRLQHE